MKKESFISAGSMSNIIVSGFGLALFILIISMITSGCGGGGEEASSSTPLLEGVFVDSPVKGLEYETPIRTGMTDAGGTFMYHEGDTIRFYIGDIILGEAMAKAIMNPVDLVDGAVDETDQAVVNMARFLQTMDDDMNPENGITITEEMAAAMQNHMINFDMDPYQFTYDPNVMMVMDAINETDPSGQTRMMVSPEDAIAHLNNSMNNMMTDNTSIMGN